MNVHLRNEAMLQVQAAIEDFEAWPSLHALFACGISNSGGYLHSTLACYTNSYMNLANIVSQNARNPRSAPQQSTTSTSALSVSLVQTTESQWTRSIPMKTALKNVSLNKCSYLGLMLITHSLPPCSLRKHLRRTKAMERS
jgi:hypothetical protein